MKKIDLSIVIVGFNTKTFLKDCLQSIEVSKKNGFEWEIIVVDNSSSDDSLEMLKNEFSKVVVIANRENLGFSSANNIGMKKAKGRLVLFLNPDTILPSDVLATMIKFMDSNPDVGVSSPRLELTNGDLDEASHRGFPTPWNSITHFSGIRRAFPKSRLFAGYTKGWLLDDKNPHEVDSVVGAFFLVRRKAGEQVGWWDEDYFWYGDELDFCYRLKEKGWKVMYVPEVTVLHYKGVAGGIKSHSRSISTASKETRLKAARSSTEAMRIFYKKHYLKKYPTLVGWLVLTGIGIIEKYRSLRARI